MTNTNGVEIEMAFTAAVRGKRYFGLTSIFVLEALCVFTCGFVNSRIFAVIRINYNSFALVFFSRKND